MRMQWGTATHAGGRRSHNEDSLLAVPPVFAVADGMGGHAHGDVASRTVVEALRELAGQAVPVRPEDVVAALQAAAEEIRGVTAQERIDPGTTGRGPVAGTTVAGAVLTEEDGEAYWLVLNVGDSRVYRFHRGRLEQVSVDHSVVQELVDAGALSAAEAAEHPQRHVITRAVGTGELPEVDFWMLRPRPGGRLLMCTDGLVGELAEDEIAGVLRRRADPQITASELVARAVRGGAEDNVTVVVVDVEGDDDQTTAPSPTEARGEEP